ncbi:hypothetical protein [Anaeropeptidivorans aminofermentans]|jgi:hypothetical protein|uniref:hypothetical protein n=1 Tax=Anaeropeptidivorans aminofermentans TaxID=2934315 RepID=UPI002023C808|nr:hypothetical protein [Anaeropeptidivorans aminofermentans]
MDDFIGMLEKAQAIYGILKDVNGGPSENQGTNMDFEKMAAFMDVVNILKSGEPYKKVEAKHSYPAFDDKIDFPALNNIKKSIPYLDQPYQNCMATLVKLIEMQKVMDKYLAYTEVIKKKAGDEWHKEVLISVRPLVNNESAYIVDNLLRFVELKDAMERAGFIRGGEKIGF